MSHQRVNELLSTASIPPGFSRTSRSFEIDGRWYFELRGGGQKGPFDSKEEMLSALNEFIQFHQEMNKQL